MANYVDAKSGSTTNSSANCPSCKKKVSIQIRGDKAYTSYKN